MLMINHYQKVSCKKMFFATKILGQGYRVANNKLTYFSKQKKKKEKRNCDNDIKMSQF